MKYPQSSSFVQSRTLALVVVVLSCCGLAIAQTLTVTFRGTRPLASTTTDQNGLPFTVAELSGVSHISHDEYLAVMDGSNKLVRLAIQLNADGSMFATNVVNGVSLSQTRDFEGIAFSHPYYDTVFLSEEDTPAVHEFAVATGQWVRTLPTPAVFANRRANRGFESLTQRSNSSEIWSCNEEALTVDGPLSTPSVGTVVRLVRYILDNGSWTAVSQFAYQTAPIHAGTSGQSGVSDLVMLPNGKLIALERSFTSTSLPFYQCRIYEVDFSSATDISGLPSLIGQSYTPVTKHHLWTGNVNNLEGLTLGPHLQAGGRALLGVVDDGDPVSTNTAVAFQLTGDIDVACDDISRCDLNCNGTVNAFDIQPFLEVLASPAPPACSVCAGDTNADGSINTFDIQGFIDCLTP